MHRSRVNLCTVWLAISKQLVHLMQGHIGLKKQERAPTEKAQPLVYCHVSSMKKLHAASRL